MQRSGVISTENLYEIKAPLATFDTIDLGDDDILYKHSHLLTTVPPHVPPKEIDIESTGSSSTTDSNREIEGQVDRPPTKKSDLEGSAVPRDKDDKSSGNKETKENLSNTTNADEVDFGSSIKNSSFKGSKVKYEQIDSTSDVSDPEPSPSPSVKHAVTGQHKLYDTDSDSSDSDSGYIRSGYISATKGVISQKKTAKGNFFPSENKNHSESDNTPTCSPRVSRQKLPPPPLSKADSAIRSKRRAYEKRLQRLQVTTNPIERPRSTTPINIVGLEEYASISSPEKSPQSGNLEKLKIRLPSEEFGRGKSPRRACRTDSKDHIFDFNEELLFTHTRSALLVQEDGYIGQSPKRVLVPPSLSPALSPANSPRNHKRSSNKETTAPFSPRFIYCPEIASLKQATNPSAIPAKPVSENWATFDDIPSASGTGNFAVNQGVDPHQDEASDVTVVAADANTGIDKASWKPNFEEEEVLTVKIEEKEGTTVCDIQCETVSNREDNETVQLPAVSSSVLENESTHTAINPNNPDSEKAQDDPPPEETSHNSLPDKPCSEENGGYV